MKILKKGFLFQTIFLLVFLISSIVSRSQNSRKSDSLVSVYSFQKSSFDKLQILYLLSEKTNNNDYKTFIEKKLNGIQSKLKDNCDRGLFSFVLGNIDSKNAKQCYIKSLQNFKSCGKYFDYSGKLYNHIATIYFREGKRDSSIYFYKKAVNVYKDNKLFSKLSAAYYELALEYYIASQVTDAIENCYNSIKIGMKQNNFDYVALSYRLLSKINRDQNTGLQYTYIDSALFYAFKSKDKYTLSHVYFQQGEFSIDEKKFEKGFEIAKKLEAIQKSDSNDITLKGDYYEYMSRYFEGRGDYKECIKFYKKTILINTENHGYIGKVGWMYNNMGDVCLKANRFNESILYLDSAISISLRLSDLHLAWYAYYNMIYAYQGLKDYKTALDYFWKYNSINDSILKKENSDKLSELQTKYQVENREIKILGLIKENAFNQEKINKENFEKKLLIFLVTLCLVIIVLITIGFLMKRHDNKLLKKQKRDIIDKTELLNKQSAEIAMYKAQMNPHFIFNAINSVQRFIVEKQTSLALEYISDLSKLIRATLNFSDKEYISIQEEIEYLQQYVRFEKLRCDNKFDFFVTIDKSLDIENVGILPMLIQPFIENSVKHGIIPKEGKGRIDLEIFKDNLAGIDILKIKITDDGIGLVASFSNKNIDIIHKSKGTEITQNRLKKLNEKYFSELTQYFNISVISNEDNTSGTKVEIVIPYIEIF